MPLNLFYTMVQKSQNDQKLKSRGGPALIKGLPDCVLIYPDQGALNIMQHCQKWPASPIGKNGDRTHSQIECAVGIRV